MRQVFLTTLWNPKGIVFAFAIFPPLDAVGANAPLWVGGFAALVPSIALAWMTLGAALGARAPGAVEAGVARKIGAVVLTGFAVALTVSALAA